MQMDRRTDMTNLIAAFRNFEDAPKKGYQIPLLSCTKYIMLVKGLISSENSTWGYAPREGLNRLRLFTVFLSHSVKQSIT